MMVHLTYSGEFAGLLLCGLNREVCLEHGDRMAHLIATPSRVVDGWRADGVLCGECDRVVGGY